MVITTAPLDFTDGDTLKRFTITNGRVRATEPAPLVSVRRLDVPDVDDRGWVYVANVVSVANGSFDVLVAAFMGDGVPGPGEFPNELASLVYLHQ